MSHKKYPSHAFTACVAQPAIKSSTTGEAFSVRTTQSRTRRRPPSAARASNHASAGEATQPASPHFAPMPSIQGSAFFAPKCSGRKFNPVAEVIVRPNSFILCSK